MILSYGDEIHTLLDSSCIVLICDLLHCMLVQLFNSHLVSILCIVSSFLTWIFSFFFLFLFSFFLSLFFSFPFFLSFSFFFSLVLTTILTLILPWFWSWFWIYILPHIGLSFTHNTYGNRHRNHSGCHSDIQN